jgi:hypothetical protein
MLLVSCVGVLDVLDWRICCRISCILLTLLLGVDDDDDDEHDEGEEVGGGGGDSDGDGDGACCATSEAGRSFKCLSLSLKVVVVGSCAIDE